MFWESQNYPQTTEEKKVKHENLSERPTDIRHFIKQRRLQQVKCSEIGFHQVNFSNIARPLETDKVAVL
jgi:hypothetical protein